MGVGVRRKRAEDDDVKPEVGGWVERGEGGVVEDEGDGEEDGVPYTLDDHVELAEEQERERRIYKVSEGEERLFYVARGWAEQFRSSPYFAHDKVAVRPGAAGRYAAPEPKAAKYCVLGPSEEEGGHGSAGARGVYPQAQPASRRDAAAAGGGASGALARVITLQPGRDAPHELFGGRRPASLSDRPAANRPKLLPNPRASGAGAGATGRDGIRSRFSSGLARLEKMEKEAEERESRGAAAAAAAAASAAGAMGAGGGRERGGGLGHGGGRATSGDPHGEAPDNNGSDQDEVAGVNEDDEDDEDYEDDDYMGGEVFDDDDDGYDDGGMDHDEGPTY